MRHTIIFLSIATILAIFIAFNATATVVIVNHDVKNYPIVTTKFFAVDDWQRIKTDIDTTGGAVQLLDNGQRIAIDSFGKSLAPTTTSSILISFDLAIGQRSGTLTDFNYASQMLAVLLSYIDTDKTETALTTFDQINIIESNFTSETNDLLTLVPEFTQSLASNIYHALTSKSTGSIPYLNNSTRENKSLILLTQGLISYDEAQLIIDAAKKSNIRIHVLYISNEVPNNIKMIAEQTGGYYMNRSDVSANQQTPYLSAMVGLAEGFIPNVAIGRSLTSCTGSHQYTVKTTQYGAGSYISKVEVANLPSLLINPPYLEYSSVIPGTSWDNSITVLAQNNDIQINDITIDNAKFEIIKGKEGLPKILKQNESFEVIVKFSPPLGDSSITFAELVFDTDACSGDTVFMTGGFPNVPPSTKTIDITMPVCSDVLVIGDTVDIEWIGLLPKDVIQLEYNIDNKSKGDTLLWDTLKYNVMGLSYRWPVPKIETDELKIKAAQWWPNNIGRTLDLWHDTSVVTAFFNYTNNGDRVITTCKGKNTAYIWNANTGEQVYTFPAVGQEVTWATYLYDSVTRKEYIGITSNDRFAYLYAAEEQNDYPLVWKYELRSSVNAIEFSKDTKYAVVSTNDGYATVLEVATGKYVSSFQLNKKDSRAVCRYAQFHPTEKYKILTITSNDGIIRIFDLMGQLLEVIDVSNGAVANSYYATYNYDGSLIAFTNQTAGNVVVVTEAGDTAYTVTHNRPGDPNQNKKIYFASFFHNDLHDWLLTSGGNGDTELCRWNAKDGTPTKLSDGESPVFPGHRGGVNSGVFSVDGWRVASASNDYTARIWNLDERELQTDITCDLRIGRAKAAIIDTFDIGEAFISETAVKTAVGLIANQCDFKYNIRSIKVTDNASGYFNIVDELRYPIVFQANAKMNLNLSFRPATTGLHYAKLEIVLPDTTLHIVLKGTAITKGLVLLTELIDFGNVYIDDLKDTTVALAVNQSNEDISITNIGIAGADYDNFKCFFDLTKPVIKPNDTLNLPIRFVPFIAGMKNAAISVAHDYNDIPIKSNLYGIGENLINDTIIVYTDNITCDVGQTVIFPIHYETKSAATIAESNLHMSLSFNASMLFPINNSSELNIDNDAISDGIRTLDLSMPYKPGTQTVEGLQFKAALGNDTITNIELKNLYAKGSNRVFLTGKGSTFILTNVCNADGLRLFDPTGSMALALEQNRPNPSSNQTIIDYDLAETGYTTLKIYNQAGVLMHTAVDGDMALGRHSIDIDAKKLPAGVYFYVLKTPTQTLTKTMLID